MKQNIRITIIPTYKCNKKCEYCIYSQYSSNINVMDLAWLDSALNSISKKYNIIQIIISGGEISLLSDFYFTMVYTLAKIYCKKIIVETNFIKLNSGIINNCDIINVGYNFDDFLNKGVIFNNIKAAVNSNKVINIKTLDICCKENPRGIIEQLNSLGIKSWEIIPYHFSKNSKISFKDYKEYETIILNYLNYQKYMKFAFQNKLQIDGILNLDNYNTNKLYLTPNNKFGVGLFKNNAFYIQEEEFFDKIVKKLLEIEKKSEIFCDKCTSKLHCMSNYFLNTEYMGYSCSGFKELLIKFKK